MRPLRKIDLRNAGANGEGRSFHLADFQKLAVMADHLCSDTKMAGI